MIAPSDRLLTWTAVVLPSTLVAALAPQAGLVPVLLFGILAAAAFVDAMNAPAAKRGIRLSLPEVVRMSRNRPAVVPLRIRKETEEPVNVKVGLPFPREVRSDNEVLDVILPAGTSETSVPWQCTPQQRGVFPITAGYFEVRSPLGFWTVRDSSGFKAELRVYPDMTRERKRLAAVFMNRGNFGIHSHRTVGQGRDFEKLRDYLPGDSFDDIHWKATAKRGKPVTKLYQIERTQEIYVIIDSSRLSARIVDGEPVLDRFIASAMLLGLVTEQQSDLFGLLVFGSRIRRFIRASGGKDHFNICRDALYTLEPEMANPDFEELRSFIRLRMRRRALLVVLTDLTDPVVSESFMQNVDTVSRQHLVLVSMLKPAAVAPLFSEPDATATADLYEKLGGHITWHRIKEIERALHHHGVGLSLVEAADLSSDMVTRYMTVKARQVL